MRASRTLAQLRAGKTVRICGLGHFIPSYVRHAAHYGFDCIWLDLEHRTMADREVQAMLAFCHQFDIDCMVRSPTREKVQLYRYLEDGAAGLMIPHVTTEEDAKELVQSTKFPPLGNRGIDGAGLDSDFYLQGGPGFTEQANAETFLIVQIESPEAVGNAEKIAAVEGVDGLFIGPADLSLRLPHAKPQMSLDEATERVAAAAAKHGKAWGRPVGLDGLKSFHQQGARLLAHGGEFLAMKDMLENSASGFDTMIGEE